MRVVEGFHVEWVEEEAVVLDPSTGHMHYLNPAAAYVFALIQEFGFEDATQRLEADFPPDSALRKELPSLLQDMVSKGLLSEG